MSYAGLSEIVFLVIRSTERTEIEMVVG